MSSSLELSDERLVPQFLAFCTGGVSAALSVLLGEEGRNMSSLSPPSVNELCCIGEESLLSESELTTMSEKV